MPRELVMVSEACQINDLDHSIRHFTASHRVSEACQINDLDHNDYYYQQIYDVSEACQINDLDHSRIGHATVDNARILAHFRIPALT